MQSPSPQTSITASSKTPAAGAALHNTWGYYAAFIALGLSSSVVGPTLLNLSENTGSRLNEISIIFLIRSLGYLIGSVQGGRLFDRIPGNRMMVLLLVGMSASLFFVPLSTSLWLLAALMFITGTTEAGIDVGGNTLLVRVHGEKVAPFMSGLHFFFGLGAFLSPVIVAQMIGLGRGITPAYWILAALIFLPVLWLFRLPSPENQTAREEADTGRSDPLLVAMIAVFFFLYVGAEVGFGSWISTFAIAREAATPTAAAYLTSLFWGALTLGRLLSIPVSVRLRPGTILLVDLLGASAGLVIILSGSHLLPLLAAGTFLTGFSMASIFPTTMNLAERRIALPGRVTRWFFVGAGLGAMVLPWLIGQWFEPLGPQVFVWLILAAVAANLLLYTGIILKPVRRAIP